jgi:hypothetical protein
MTTYGSTSGSTRLRDEGFTQLRKGEAVEIPLWPQEPLVLVLANHPFYVVSEGGLYLVDEANQRYPLRSGRNIVGRDPQCDTVVDAAFKDVSRKHLLIETQGEAALRLTDISSLGTAVPVERLTEAVRSAR